MFASLGYIWNLRTDLSLVGGIIIQPKPAFAFDGRDKEKLSAFRELIAPTVDKVNDYAPTHSRLMTEVSSPKHY